MRPVSAFYKVIIFLALFSCEGAKSINSELPTKLCKSPAFNIKKLACYTTVTDLARSLGGPYSSWEHDDSQYSPTTNCGSITIRKELNNVGWIILPQNALQDNKEIVELNIYYFREDKKIFKLELKTNPLIAEDISCLADLPYFPGNLIFEMYLNVDDMINWNLVKSTMDSQKYSAIIIRKGRTPRKFNEDDLQDNPIKQNTK